MKKLNTIYSIICICCLATITITAQSYEWAKNMGQIITHGHSIAVDNSGNVYTTGYFNGSVDFDPGAGISTLTSAGDWDVFISKLDASGNFVWAIKMGGMSDDIANNIALDVFGNVYTTGSFEGTADFDPDDVGTYNLYSEGYVDIFVSKLDSAGNFVWAKNMGGNSVSDDIGNSIIVDSLGDVYTTGSFNGTADFDPGVGIYNLTSRGYEDIFISKLDASGNFVGAKKMGGTESDVGNSIIIDASENVYITGSFKGTADFDPDEVAIHNLISEGGTDIFITKLDALGHFVGAKRMGGILADVGNSITLDTSENVYITGYFEDTVDFDPDATEVHELISKGGRDVFISKLDAFGHFVGAKSMGGTSSDEGNSINVDISGNVYITGSFNRTIDFGSDSGIDDLISEGGDDIFICKLDASGSFVNAKSMGGTYSDFGYSITTDASGNIYTTGSFMGTVDFDPGAGTDNLTADTVSDVFVQKLSSTILSLKNNIIGNPVVAFPNPTTENITLDLGKRYDAVTLRVKNFSGALISTSNYRKTDKIDFTIDGSAGIYIVEAFVDNEKIRTLKVIKH